MPLSLRPVTELRALFKTEKRFGLVAKLARFDEGCSRVDDPASAFVLRKRDPHRVRRHGRLRLIEHAVHAVHVAVLCGVAGVADVVGLGGRRAVLGFAPGDTQV